MAAAALLLWWRHLAKYRWLIAPLLLLLLFVVAAPHVKQITDVVDQAPQGKRSERPPVAFFCLSRYPENVLKLSRVKGNGLFCVGLLAASW